MEASLVQAAPRSSRDAGTSDVARGERFGKSRLVSDPYASHVPEMDGKFHRRSTSASTSLSVSLVSRQIVMTN